MTTQEKMDLVSLIKNIQHSYHLEQYTSAALQPLVKALDQAQSEVIASITSKAAELTEWQEERALALLDEYSNLQLGLRNALGESIAEIGAHAGASSYLVHNDILSFSGAVNGFNNVALTASQVQQMLVSTPIGGQLLSGWIDSAFEAQKEGIRQEVLTGMLKGEGYPAMVRRLREGYDMSREDAISIARSYVQAANVNAAHDVAKANSEIMKGWKWESATENGAYYTKSGKGRGRGICMICLALASSDEIYPMDGGPEIPQHVRCRCVRRYVTKTWRELGIPVDEIESAARPYTVRGKGIDAETGEIITQSVGTGGRNILSVGLIKGDYEDFFKQVLTPIEQKMTIGPMRLELYNSGKIKSLGDLVEVVDGKARLRLLERVDGKVVGLKELAKAEKETVYKTTIKATARSPIGRDLAAEALVDKQVAKDYAAYWSDAAVKERTNATMVSKAEKMYARGEITQAKYSELTSKYGGAIPEKIGWVEAKTIKEAEDIGLANIKGIKNLDYSGMDLEVANEVNRAAIKLSHSFDIDIPELAPADKMPKMFHKLDHPMAASSQGIAYTRTDWVGGAKDNLLAYIKAHGGGVAGGSNDVFGYAAHEIGHILQHTPQDAAGKVLPWLRMDDLVRPIVDKYRRSLGSIDVKIELGRYAGGSWGETWAEAFSGYVKNKAKLRPETVKMVEDVLDKVRPKVKL